MNPQQLRESTLHQDTRRLLQLNIDTHSNPTPIFDKLLSKKRSQDRKLWLESCGNRVQVR